MPLDAAADADAMPRRMLIRYAASRRCYAAAGHYALLLIRYYADDATFSDVSPRFRYAAADIYRCCC